MGVLVHFSALTRGENDEDEHERLVLKELVIINPDLDCSQSWIFKPPFPYSQLTTALRLHNDYLSQHLYGLHWNDGDTLYSEVKSVITKYTQHSSVVYTFGKTRQFFLESILGKSVINLEEELKCPHFSQLAYPSRQCLHYLHRFSYFRCAVKEGWTYANYIKFYELGLSVLNQNKCVYIPSPITNNVDGPTDESDFK